MATSLLIISCMVHTTLTKKTKTELLEEYDKLLAAHEELRRTARLVADPQSVSLITQVEGYTMEQLTQSIVALKSSVNINLNELSEKLIGEAQKFGELQKAIELVKKNLELHYHIQVAAETLEQLVVQHQSKTVALDQEMAVKQRDWVREQEEHEYHERMRARRAQEEFDEQKKKQERELKDRIATLATQEQEASNLRARVEGFPAQLEKALSQREQEVAKRFHIDEEEHLSRARKEWEAEEELYKMRIANLEERVKATTGEAAALRAEVEKANKRIQELAVTIIESGSKASGAPDDHKTRRPEGAAT